MLAAEPLGIILALLILRTFQPVWSFIIPRYGLARNCYSWRGFLLTPMLRQIKTKFLNLGTICSALLSILGVVAFFQKDFRDLVFSIFSFLADNAFWVILLPMSAALLVMALERSGYWLSPLDKKFLEAIADLGSPEYSQVQKLAQLTPAQFKILMTRHGAEGANHVTSGTGYGRQGGSYKVSAYAFVKLTPKGEKRARNCGIIKF